jgi:flagellar biosynthesis/type III secretory pathway M-ring protein FliF/YscJ
MSGNKHDVESQGAKPRDHEHPRHHFWKHAHKSWWLWIVVVLMLALILVYVVTDSLSLRPGRKATQPIPAANAP